MPNVSKKKFIDNYIRNIPQILSHQIVADTETPVSTLLMTSTNVSVKSKTSSLIKHKLRSYFS